MTHTPLHTKKKKKKKTKQKRKQHIIDINDPRLIAIPLKINRLFMAAQKFR